MCESADAPRSEVTCAGKTDSASAAPSFFFPKQRIFAHGWLLCCIEFVLISSKFFPLWRSLDWRDASSIVFSIGKRNEGKRETERMSERETEREGCANHGSGSCLPSHLYSAQPPT